MSSERCRIQSEEVLRGVDFTGIGTKSKHFVVQAFKRPLKLLDMYPSLVQPGATATFT